MPTLELSHRLASSLFEEDDKFPQFARFDPEGARVLIGGEGCSRSHIYDVASGELLHELKYRYITFAGDFFPNAKQVLLAGTKHAQVFDLNTNKGVLKLKGVHVFWDNMYVAAGQGRVALPDKKGGLLAFECSGWSQLAKLEAPKGQQFWSAAWLDDETLLALVGVRDYNDKLQRREQRAAFHVLGMDAKLGEPMLPFEMRDRAWVLSPDRKQVFVRDWDDDAVPGGSQARLIDARSGEIRAELPVNGKPSRASKLHFCGPERVVALETIYAKAKDSSSGRDVLSVWDLSAKSYTSIPLPREDLGAVKALAVGPQGQLALVSYDGMTLASLA